VSSLIGNTELTVAVRIVLLQREKLDKMKANFSKYIAQVVEMEERQRKTFLLSHEAQRLHVAKDGEDWRELESLKGGDPKLRDKLKDIQKDHKTATDSIGTKYDTIAGGAIPAEAAKNMELEYAAAQRQLREKVRLDTRAVHLCSSAVLLVYDLLLTSH